ncbi:MAG: DUF1653 domain-containing protein [Atopobiaceae bacterium]
MGKSKEICSCKHVTKDEIREAVRQGATSYKDVKRATGAGSKCGKCRHKVEKIIEEELRKIEEEAQGTAPEVPECSTLPLPGIADAAPEAASESEAPAAAPEPQEEAPSFAADMAERAVPAQKQEVRIGGIYRHFKGDYYLVEGTATGSEDGRQYVVYRKLYGDGGLWIRPLEMFLSPVDRKRYPEATQDERFCLVDVASVRNR